jgi:hypothetical protein
MTSSLSFRTNYNVSNLNPFSSNHKIYLYHNHYQLQLQLPTNYNYNYNYNYNHNCTTNYNYNYNYIKRSTCNKLHSLSTSIIVLVLGSRNYFSPNWIAKI